MPIYGGFFDIDVKLKRLEQLEVEAQNPKVWGDPKGMEKLNREKVLVEKSVQDWRGLFQKVEDAITLLDMAKEAHDEETFEEVKSELQHVETAAEELELKSLLSGELDPGDCYLSVNSGAGGTEAQDWAGMLLRMYQRYCEENDYRVQVEALHDGEEAGIKSATLHVQGPYAFGHLKAETGVHRLVRISPFDSNARRHTSFASVHVFPDIDDDVEIEVRDEDLRVDTYRASGAGGQHINRTDSAVRMTHLPSGIVVQCQSQRSQIANRDKAMKMLKAALYEKELERLKAEKEAAAGEKKSNEWGSQIRSYVLHPYQMVKDHRTSTESGNPSSVLDGGLDLFIRAQLKSQLAEKKEEAK